MSAADSSSKILIVCKKKNFVEQKSLKAIAFFKTICYNINYCK